MKLFQELKQLDEDKEILNEFDGIFWQNTAESLLNIMAHDNSGIVAEGFVLILIFAAGNLWNYYSNVFGNMKEFVQKIVRIQKIKDPQKQYAELRSLSDEIEKTVEDAIKNKKVDPKVRKELKAVQQGMFGKIKRMEAFIEDYKKTGKYPGAGWNDPPESKIKNYISKWAGELKALRDKVNSAVEKASE